MILGETSDFASVGLQKVLLGGDCIPGSSESH